MDGRTYPLVRVLFSLLIALSLSGAALGWQADEDDDQPPTLPETEVEGDAVNPSDDFDPVDANGDFNSIIDNSVFSSPPAFGYGAESNTTGAIINVPDLQLPASVDVVTRPTINDQQIINVQQMLRNIAGATIVGDEGQFADGFFLRGMAVRQTDYRKNGFFDPTLTPRDFANIERIEILKGPASVLYGSGNPAGTVNVITDKPMACEFTEFEFQPGSFGQNRYVLDTNGFANDCGNVMYRVNAAYEDADSFRDFGYLDRQIVAPSLRWLIDDCTMLTWEAEYVENDRNSDLGFPTVGGDPLFLPPNFYTGMPGIDFLHNEDYRTSLVLEKDFCNGWALWAGVQTVWYEAPIASTGIFTPTPFPNFFTREHGTLDDEASSSSLIVNLTKDACIAGMNHRLLFGTEQIYFDEAAFFTRGFVNEPGFDVLDPDYSDFTSTTFFDAATPVFRYSRNGFYAQDLIEVNEHWTLLGGVRFDHLDFEAERVISGFGPIPQLNQDFDAVSPRAGIVYSPIPDRLSFYANYSRSFTPPTGEALLFANPAVPLEKETGEGYEAGIKARLLDCLILHTAAFHVTRENAPFFDQGTLTFFQVGQKRSQGVEFELIGEVTERLSVLCNYAYVDTELTDPNDPRIFGQRQRNVPYNTSSLWGRYNLVDDCCQTFGLGAGMLLVDDRTADLEASLLLPSYTRFDAGVFYERGCWDAVLYLENLGDIEYATGSQNTLRVFPGAPFNVRGMVGVRF